MKKFYSISFILLFLNVILIGQSRIYAPNLRAPLNNAVNENPDVTLDWDAVTGQTTNITYEVQLATQSDFSDAVTFPRTEYTALKMNELFFGEVYYWRVMAFDDEEPSDWSEVWSFNVVSSVNIIDPDINEEVFTTTLIQWEPISGLNAFQMQIDTTNEWKSQMEVTEENINGSFSLNMNNIWLVGDGGSIFNYNGSNWISVESETSEDLNAVSFMDEMNGYAVGMGGTLLNYNPDSAKWFLVDLGITDDLTGISFSGTNDGWIVGSNGTIVRYQDGSWTVENPSEIEDIAGVYALSSDNVWICGGKMIGHWNGTEWMTESVGNKDHYSIWFIDQNNGWTVSKDGKIYYFNGNEWTEQTSNTNKDLYAVCFSGSQGFAVGEGGVMVNYIGSWQPVSSESDVDLNTISISNVDGAGLLAGMNGNIVLKTTGGFDSPYLRNISIIPDTASYEISNLLFGKKIYYRMRAMHSLDTTQWTGGLSLITQAAPELDKPNNNATDTDLDLLFKWKEYEGATDYTFHVSPYEDFTDGYIISIDSLSTEYVAKFFGQKYYWRVNAANGMDVSDWSETRVLTTASMVDLDNPENNAEKISTCPAYEWNEIVGAPSYQLWIDKDINFTQPTKIVSNIPSFQCQNPLDRNTVYYWKVRATTSVDTSDWSEIWSFKVEGYAGIDDGFSSEYVDIYPNPATDNVSLTINSHVSETYVINICDLTGKVILEEILDCRIGENDFNLSLTGFEKGLYLINISLKEQSVSKKLFIK